MELIVLPTFIPLYLLAFGGGALLALIVMAHTSLRQPSPGRTIGRWVLVLALCAVQVAFWQATERFGSISSSNRGDGNDDTVPLQWTVIALMLPWLAHQMWRFIRMRRLGRQPQETTRDRARNAAAQTRVSDMPAETPNVTPGRSSGQRRLQFTVLAFLAPFLALPLAMLVGWWPLGCFQSSGFEGAACGLQAMVLGVGLGLFAGVFLAIQALKRKERRGLGLLALGFNAVPLVYLVGVFVLSIFVSPHSGGQPPERQDGSVNQDTGQTPQQARAGSQQDSPTDPQREPAARAAGPVARLPAGTLLFAAATAGEIRRLAPDGQKLPSLVGGLRGPNDVELDAEHGLLFISQWAQPIVRSLDLATGELRDVYRGSSAGGQGVAVDRQAGSLFWGEYYGGLYRGSPDGQAPPQLLVSPEDLAVCEGGVGAGIEVDPETRQVYFFSRDNCDARGRALWRVGYDGAGLTRLRQLESSDCLKLIRHDGRWLLFSDLRDGRYQMWRIRPDGSQAQWLFDLPQPDRPCSGVVVDARSERMYFLQAGGEPRNLSDLWRSDVAGRGLELVDRDIRGGQGLLLVP